MGYLSSLGVLGAGPMGSAIITGAIEASRIAPESILAVDRDEARRDAMAALGCRVDADAQALSEHACVVLALRPQDFMAAGSAVHSDSPRLVISVMAGLDTETIAQASGPASRVVRTMPNTAASIGAAVVGIAPGAGATDADLDIATALMRCVGRVVRLEEAQMHALTAVSGSGPAWVFLLAEAMQAEALVLGLSPEQVHELIRGTLQGAAALLDRHEGDPGTLRAAVTTPGGTTEAGLKAMRDGGFVEAVRAGIRAACCRGVALADGGDCPPAS